MDAASPMPSFLIHFLTQLVGMLPILLVYLGGIVLALILWGRAPRPALFVVLGLGLMLLVSVGGTCLFTWAVEAGPDAARSGTLLSILGFARSLLHAAGLCLLLAAAFIDRSRPYPAPGDRDEGPPPPRHAPGPSPHVTADRPPPA